MKETNTYKDFLFVAVLGILMIAVFVMHFIFLAVENEKLSNENKCLMAELEEMCYIEEGEILSTDDLETGGVIYVLYLDDEDIPAAIIMVDVYPELIHTTIEVGDIAVYIRDRNWTDADLLAIEKMQTEVRSESIISSSTT